MARFRLVVALAVFALLVTGMSVLGLIAPPSADAADVAKPAPAAKPEGAEAAAAPAQEAPATTGIMYYIKAGGPVGGVIIAVSFLGVTWILRHMFFLRRNVLAPKKVQRQLSEFFTQKKIKEAVEYCQKNRSVLARIVGSGLAEIRSGYDAMSEVMEEVGEEEAIRINQSVGMLSLVGAIAPMLGLLGTVLGMMAAFRAIGSGGMAKPAELASNIQLALTTTCMGLIVAVPAIVAYTIFRNKAVRVMLEVAVIANDLTSRFRNVRVTASSTSEVPAPAKAEPAKKAPAPKPGDEKKAPAPKPGDEKKAPAPKPGDEKKTPAPKPEDAKNAPAPKPDDEKK